MEASAKEMGIPEGEYREILKRLGRAPNRVELLLFKVMWSEHCAYKNSRPLLKELPKEGEAVLQARGRTPAWCGSGRGGRWPSR
jgi:phosphoribosylformylglycinamidine synthase